MKKNTSYEKWNSRFINSLKRWVKLRDNIKDPGDINSYLGSADHLIREIVCVRNEDDELTKAIKILV